MIHDHSMDIIPHWSDRELSDIRSFNSDLW